VFSHYKPVQGWPYTQQDIWLAVPPEWNAPPITQQGSGRWVGAFLTHDAMEVHLCALVACICTASCLEELIIADALPFLKLLRCETLLFASSS